MKAVLLIVLFSLIIGGCNRSNEDIDSQISIDVTAFPLSMPANGVSQAVVWATVKKNGRPAGDSTLVQFASTRGIIESSAYTRDGLASVIITSDTIPGIALIVGYVELATDSVNINMGTIE